MVLGSSGLPRVAVAGRRGGAGGAREEVLSVRGVAAGVAETRNTSGMMLVMFLPIYTAIGGP